MAMRKKLVVRVIATVLALLMILGLLVTIIVYAGDTPDDILTTTAAKEPTEVPLLVILLSYDANGNGKNDFDASNPTKLYADKTAEYYGEQWAQTSPTEHYNRFFSTKGYTLRNYYSEMSLGAFTYKPVQFQNAESLLCKDGVLPITINQMHPSATTGTANQTLVNAVSACDDYIDFAALDVNDDGIVGQLELGIVILNAGPDHAYTNLYLNAAYPKNYFAVHGTSQSITVTLDGVTLRSTTGGGNVTNQGEYSKVGTLLPIGVPCHELAHNLGAEDLYDRKINASGNVIGTWPQPNAFSLMDNGGGDLPSYLDPYHRIMIGWADVTEVTEDGEYTLYSTLSGKYNVIKIRTPDPKEYFLVEIRLKEGFEKNITSAKCLGGIMIWHIDEDINDRYFKEGMADSSYIDSRTGERHDPGIYPIFNGYMNKTNGQFTQTGQLANVFYYKSSNARTSTFNSSDFVSPTKQVRSLHSYPANWVGEQNHNLKITVLSEPGAEMKISVEGAASPLLDNPVFRMDSLTSTDKTVDVSAKISKLNDNVVESCGFIISTESTPTEENGTYKEAVYNADTLSFSTSFDGLTPETEYYCVAVIKTAQGTVTNSPYKFTTKSTPVETTAPVTTPAETTPAETTVAEPEPTSAPATEATTPVETTGAAGEKDNNPMLIIIIVAAVVLIAGAVVVTVIVKRSAKK